MVVTRAEFYRDIWETPAAHLAKKYGVSDVTIGKICRRHAIPKPWKGYWTEIEHGKKPVRPSLPPSDGVITIEIKAVVRSRTAGKLPEDKLVSPIRNKRPEVPAIKNWDHDHPQTKNLRAAIQSSGEDQTGRVGDQREGVTRAVLVSRPLVARALTFLDSLFRLLEETGCTVSVSHTPGPPSSPSQTR